MMDKYSDKGRRDPAVLGSLLPVDLNRSNWTQEVFVVGPVKNAPLRTNLVGPRTR
jgi:hypothetical protein